MSQCTAWEPFRDLIPENERESFIHAYKKRLNSDDVETQVSVAFYLIENFIFKDLLAVRSVFYLSDPKNLSNIGLLRMEVSELSKITIEAGPAQ